MVSTAATPSPFDPLDRMDPDEDRFVLREKDPVAPATITAWTHLRRNRALKLYSAGQCRRQRRSNRRFNRLCNGSAPFRCPWTSPTLRNSPRSQRPANTSQQHPSQGSKPCWVIGMEGMDDG